MNKVLVWDIPTRLFHWAFAGSICAAFFFALVMEDEGPLFQLHMLFGLVALFLLIFRVALGFFGSRHARFFQFPVRPAEIVEYFAGIVSGRARKYAGHNPGSALAAFAMFALVPVIVLTGLNQGGEEAEEIHGVFAYTLLAVIGAHLLGLVVHSFRHHENAATSMVTGMKTDVPDEGIRSAHPIWGIALFGAAAAWIVALFSNHDAQAATVRLPVLGTVVRLGENEGGEHEGREHEKHGGRKSERHHDDD